MQILLSAIFLDLIIGDPKFLIHPVEIIGYFISKLRLFIDNFSRDNKTYLRVGGFFLTILVVSSSGLFGWTIEQLYIRNTAFISYLGLFSLIILLASTLAFKSLAVSTKSVIKFINVDQYKNIKKARENLAFIVGRDVNNLDEDEIIRAVVETASENSVDGIFAPLFWIFIGFLNWKISLFLPGPLSLALIFKSTSTIDSMIGYKYGSLKWIGYSGAKLDDMLTYIPSRLVAISLPIVTRPINQYLKLIKIAFKDGAKDTSPNSGLSEAIFAHCLNIKMGGENFYNGKKIIKPYFAELAPKPNLIAINKILVSVIKLEIFWVVIFYILIK